MADIDLELVTYEGLDERIVVVRAGDEVDSVFVLTERFGVLVDTLATPSLCARALKLLTDRLNNRPLVVINSHMDWDHYWGNAALGARTQIIAHGEAIKRLRDPNTAQELAEKRSQEARFREVEIVPPTMTFSGRTMSLHGGDLTLELIHTPGHTPDHVAVWIPELCTCLAVDAVENPIPEVWSQSPDDLRKLCLSLTQIRDLHPRHVILAHGQTADPEIVDRNIDYFTRLRDAVRGLRNVPRVAEGLSERPGFQLEDFVTVSPNMLLQTRAFYQRCHKSNLNAAIAAHAAGVDFL
ncbi:MBL fold metallo-hydrolase [uncultured Roseibium sp.]|uniref:MBL fold metallo-hydrolase n=1 Tax=uncultured Roseibium sp. TaxID=1936171 RepID=UPI002622C6E7|nr:MBL fold metallo-hydrolase [uncultured Roseibium sp.]